MFLILETVFSKSFGANQKLCFSRNRERRALTVKTVWFAVLALLVTFLVLSVSSVTAAALQSSASANTPRAQTTYTYYLPFLANRYVMSGTTGSYTTYLAIQNTSSATANITVAYYASNGNVLATPPTNCVAINPLAECVASNPFAMGKRGTGVVTSDQPLSIIVGEATPFGGTAFAANAQPSNVNEVPIALNNAFGGFNTQIIIFNPGISGGANINFYDKNGNVVASKSVPIPILTTQILDLRDPALGLPDGFSGWALILAGPEIGDELVVQTLEYKLNHHFVAVLGQPFINTTLYAPAIFNQAFGSYVTGISLVNPYAALITSTITYYDNLGKAYPTDPFTLPAFGATTIYNGGSGGVGLPVNGLPVGFYGSAIVKVQGQGAVMAVNEVGSATADGQSVSGAYAATTSGKNNIDLPVVSNGGFGFTTGLTIQNISSSAISCTMQYYRVDGNVQGTALTYNIPANASQVIYQGAADLPPGFYGTAVITQNTGSSGSLIVATNAISPDTFYAYSVPNQ